MQWKYYCAIILRGVLQDGGLTGLAGVGTLCYGASAAVIVVTFFFIFSLHISSFLGKLNQTYSRHPINDYYC